MLVCLIGAMLKEWPVGDGSVIPTAPLNEPYAVAVHPLDQSVWVSCLKTEDVRVFDPGPKTWRAPIATGGSPFAGDFTDDGALFIVPNQRTETLAFVDGATAMVTTTLILPAQACRSPHMVRILPDQQRALVVCEGDHIAPGTVAVVGGIRTATPAVDTFRTVGVFPDDAIFLEAP